MVSEAANNYLDTIPTKNRATAQEQIFKFCRWIGSTKSTSDLTPFIISSYSDQTAVSTIKYVKSFLKYLHKNQLNKSNLATNLKGKKTSRSKVSSTQLAARNVSNLTSQGYSKLTTELEELKIQRAEVTVELRRAAADKDFKENAPLHAARDRKSLLEGRIQQIEAIVKTAIIIDSSEVSSKIKIGDTILLEDLSTGKQIRYKLVDSKESNIEMKKCSTVSPIGKALLNKEKGQIVEVIAPGGSFPYRIKEIINNN